MSGTDENTPLLNNKENSDKTGIVDTISKSMKKHSIFWIIGAVLLSIVIIVVVILCKKGVIGKKKEGYKKETFVMEDSDRNDDLYAFSKDWIYAVMGQLSPDDSETESA